MKNALIGHNGFLGSNLKYQTEFGFFFNSENIHTIKNNILPSGDVINGNTGIVRSNMSKYKLLDKILDILNLTVSSAVDANDRNVGCILVLHALSEISRECVESNSWLL